MSNLHIGQRVRMARPDGGSNMRGLYGGEQGMISSKCSKVDYRVEFPGHVNPFTGHETFPCYRDELDPILQQNQPCDAEFKASLDKLLAGLPA